MIIEDMHEARNRGEEKHEAALADVLRNFLHRHPEAAVGKEVD